MFILSYIYYILISIDAETKDSVFSNCFGPIPFISLKDKIYIFERNARDITIYYSLVYSLLSHFFLLLLVKSHSVLTIDMFYVFRSDEKIRA